MPEDQTASAARFTFDKHPHGSGGFAKVIRGRDNFLERDIAVKVLDPLTTAFSEPEQERFRREARILARLSHPNIPSIYDVDFGPGRFQIIFQFIDGQTLRQIIEEQGPCQVSQVKAWFLQISSALEHAHKLGVIHRDIKPENIIITSAREAAYLVDFGIALSGEEVKRLTNSGFVIGTAGYMSPEQSAGEPVDFRTDIYSLAVTLYEALAGKAIPVGHYEALSLFNEAIPPEIDDLIQDSLLPRKERLDSIRTFGSRLSGALRPAKPLSDILAHGRLHELASSIEIITATDFIKLPEGQRALILAKLTDLVASGDPKLDFACERLLELLLTRGLLLDKEDYREVVTPAIHWGFEKAVNEYLGRPSVRRALEEAAYEARGEALDVLKEEFAKYLKEIDLASKEEWYLNGVRDVLESLLSNPGLVSGTGDLVAALRSLNKAHRQKVGAKLSRIA